MVLRSALAICLLFVSHVVVGKTVLVIESYHAEYDWVISHKNGFEESIGNHDLHYFEMDTKRIAKSQFQVKADAAWQKYQQLKPDLVVLADDNALEYMAPKLLTTNTPVVYLGINENPRQYGVVSAGNFYGVLERLLIKRSVLFIKEFLPVQRLLIIFDTGKTSQTIFNNTFSAKPLLTLADVSVDVLQVDDFDVLKYSVNHAKQDQYDAILIGLYHNLTDSNGMHIKEENVIEWVSSNTEVPLFGLWDFSVGPKKAIGGYVISGYDQGKAAAQIAVKLLNGQSSPTLPETALNGRFKFSQSQLEKWNVRVPSNISRNAIIVD